MREVHPTRWDRHSILTSLRNDVARLGQEARCHHVDGLDVLEHIVQVLDAAGAALPHDPAPHVAAQRVARATARRLPLEPSAEQTTAVRSAQEKDNALAVFRPATGEAEEVLGLDLQRLLPDAWLSDVLINSYLGMLQARCNELRANDQRRVNYHFWSTHRYAQLSGTTVSFSADGRHSVVDLGYSYSREAARWWRRKSSLQILDVVSIIPVNLSNAHWCLCVVNPVEFRLDYYDPIEGSRNGEANFKAISYILRYYENKHRERSPGVPPSFLINLPACPEQLNSCDCGVFACQIANYLTSNAQLDFTQADMPMFRIRLTCDILQGSATAPASPTP